MVINGLRQQSTGFYVPCLRKGVRSLDDLEDGVAKIAIETSHPEWLIKRWIELYGEKDTIAMAHENNNPASVTDESTPQKQLLMKRSPHLNPREFEVQRGEVNFLKA